MAPALIVVLLLALTASARATAPAAALPADLPAAERARLSEVTERASVSARSGRDTVRVRRDLFEYLLDHPELASHIIQALQINRFRIWREPDGLWLDDRAGALVMFQLAYSAPGSRVFFMQGRYQPAVLPAIYGRVVAVLEYTVAPADQGKSLITPAMATFVRIDNAVYGVLARLFDRQRSGCGRRGAARPTRRAGERSRRVPAAPGSPLSPARAGAIAAASRGACTRRRWRRARRGDRRAP
jgi:hypothetical protein